MNSHPPILTTLHLDSRQHLCSHRVIVEPLGLILWIRRERRSWFSGWKINDDFLYRLSRCGVLNVHVLGTSARTATITTDRSRVHVGVVQLRQVLKIPFDSQLGRSDRFPPRLARILYTIQTRTIWHRNTEPLSARSWFPLPPCECTLMLVPVLISRLFL